jgi:hypothetical protein
MFKLRLYLALCAKHGWLEIKATYRKLVVIAPPFESLRAKLLGHELVEWLCAGHSSQ